MEFMDKIKKTNYQDFVKQLNLLIEEKLSHIDFYYQKLDLHFGQYTFNGEESFGDYVLYLSGFWEILDSGKAILVENDSEEKKIKFFDEQLINSKVKSIKTFEKPKEIFIEFDNKKIIHCIEEDNRWVEILSKSGELFKIKK